MKQFTGPLLIVGMPRSGTKLLRDLLNRHPRISLPVSESHFIPSMVARFGWSPRLDAALRREVYAALTRTTFFHNMKARDRVLAPERLEQGSDRQGWHELLEIVLRFYGCCEDDPNVIWGDKTPEHLVHMEMLRTLCPQARFVHIIRDPRDYCLSVRRVWGKTIERAAERWRRDVETARRSGGRLGDAYLEVTYEGLVSDPRSVVGEVCAFLDCEASEHMLQTGRATENLGSAQGSSAILSDNYGKYRIELTRPQVRRIEEIVRPVMAELGYAFEHDVEFRPLSDLRLRAAAIRDAWAMIRFHARNRGLLGGVRYQGRAFAQANRRSS